MGAGYAALRGDSEQGFGCGHANLPLPENTKGDADYGLSLACRRVTQLIMETHDIGLIASTVVNAPRQFQTVANLAGMCAGTFSNLVTSISHQCRVAGTVVSGLETFAAYYNAGPGGPWNCLLSPLFAELFVLLFPSSPLPASSVMPEPGSLALAASGKSIVITPRSAAHAGYEEVSAISTGAVYSEKGSRTLTVTGTSLGAGGIGGSNSVWTVELPEDAVSATLTPVITGNRLVSVISVSLPTGMISGSVQVSGISGRDYPLIPR